MSLSFDGQLLERLLAYIEAMGDELLPGELTHPSSVDTLYYVLETIKDNIKGGERIQVTVPRSYSHDRNGEHDVHALARVQSVVSGGFMSGRANVFATLRYEKYPASDVVVDICCLADVTGGNSATVGYIAP